MGEEEIQLRRIDSILGQFASPTEPLFLDVNTQGYELEVLRGAEESLGQIRGVQLELSLQLMYEGQAGYLEVSSYLGGKGISDRADGAGVVRRRLEHAPGG